MKQNGLRNAGIAVLCDPAGIVQRVARDDLELSDRVPAGQSILSLADPIDASKARLFLDTLQENSVVRDWQIHTQRKGQLQLLHFSGCRLDGGYLVIAALNSETGQSIYREIAGKPLEQAPKGAENKHSKEPTGGGQEECFVQLSRLNSELANFQRELWKKNAELEHLNQEKSEFLGIAAHELRSPVSVILTYSEFLEIDPALGEQQREFISAIKTSSRYLLQLINEFLDVSRIEVGRMEINLVPTNLPALIEARITLHRLLAQPKGIRINLELDTSLPKIWVDPGRIEQILHNLLGNALKFTRSPGDITVRLDRKSDWAVITVCDQGPGIPKEEHTKLFKAFSRTKVLPPGGEIGVGLGLWIVRRIAEAHQGSVGVQSEPGKGTTFEVRLPLNPKPGQAGEGRIHDPI